MLDLLRINNAYVVVPRGTATEGIFVCVVSKALAESVGWWGSGERDLDGSHCA